MKIAYHTEKGGAVIDCCRGELQRVELPEQLDDCPVQALAAYAFSDAGGATAFPGACPESREEAKKICGQQLREIRLPESLRRIGNYAFYGCRNLEKISLYHQTEDIAGGAFTGCHSLRYLDVYMKDAWGYCLKDLVSELHHEIYVNLLYEDGSRACLLFPEYYEESVENTPARILETHFLGSGYHYRQCFQDGNFCFAEYDRLFFEAAAWESCDFCIELALLRLRFPIRLSGDAKGTYQAWLMEHRMEAASWCMEFEQQDAFRHLCAFIDWSAQELSGLIALAHEKNALELQSFLLDYRRRMGKREEKTFLL